MKNSIQRKIKKNDLKLKPIITYDNLLQNKLLLYGENRNKSGIYRWVNIITNENYIGSTNNLTNRLKVYFSKKSIENRLLKYNSPLYKGLLKYGYSKFKLEILEYCNKESLLKREQYYLDLTNPEYNILKTAGSPKGFKHSAETLLKFKNRDLNTGHVTTVINKSNNDIKKFYSLREAARNLGVSHTALLDHVNTNNLLKKVYLILKNKLSENPDNLANGKNITITIKVHNKLENLTYEFSSKRSAARFLSIKNNVIISTKTISKYIKSKELYRDIYYIYV